MAEIMEEELELTLEQKEKLANTIKGMERDGVPKEIIQASFGKISSDFKKENKKDQDVRAKIRLPEVEVRGGESTLTTEDFELPKKEVVKKGNSFLKGIGLELEENIGVFTQSVDLNNPEDDTSSTIRVGPQTNENVTVHGIPRKEFYDKTVEDKLNYLEENEDFSSELYRTSISNIYKSTPTVKHPTENRYLKVEELNTDQFIDYRNDIYSNLMNDYYNSPEGINNIDNNILPTFNEKLEGLKKEVDLMVQNDELSEEGAKWWLQKASMVIMTDLLKDNKEYQVVKQTNERALRGSLDEEAAARLDSDFEDDFYPNWIGDNNLAKGIYQGYAIYGPQASNTNSLNFNSKKLRGILQNLDVIDKYELGGDDIMSRDKGDGWYIKNDHHKREELRKGKIYHPGVSNIWNSEGKEDEKGNIYAPLNFPAGYYTKEELREKLINLDKAYRFEISVNLANNQDFKEKIQGLGNLSFFNEKWEYTATWDDWKQELGKQMFNSLAGMFTGSLYAIGVENAGAFSELLDAEASKRVSDWDKLSEDEKDKIRLRILDDGVSDEMVNAMIHGNKENWEFTDIPGEITSKARGVGIVNGTLETLSDGFVFFRGASIATKLIPTRLWKEMMVGYYKTAIQLGKDISKVSLQTGVIETFVENFQEISKETALWSMDNPWGYKINDAVNLTLSTISTSIFMPLGGSITQTLSNQYEYSFSESKLIADIKKVDEKLLAELAKDPNNTELQEHYQKAISINDKLSSIMDDSRYDDLKAWFEDPNAKLNIIEEIGVIVDLQEEISLVKQRLEQFEKQTFEGDKEIANPIVSEQERQLKTKLEQLSEDLVDAQKNIKYEQIKAEYLKDFNRESKNANADPNSNKAFYSFASNDRLVEFLISNGLDPSIKEHSDYIERIYDGTNFGMFSELKDENGKYIMAISEENTDSFIRKHALDYGFIAGNVIFHEGLHANMKDLSDKKVQEIGYNIQRVLLENKDKTGIFDTHEFIKTRIVYGSSLIEGKDYKLNKKGEFTYLSRKAAEEYFAYFSDGLAGVSMNDFSRKGKEALSDMKEIFTEISKGKLTDKNILTFLKLYNQNNLNKPGKPADMWVDENGIPQNFFYDEISIVEKVEKEAEIKESSIVTTMIEMKDLRYGKDSEKIITKTKELMDDLAFVTSNPINKETGEPIMTSIQIARKTKSIIDDLVILNSGSVGTIIQKPKYGFKEELSYILDREEFELQVMKEYATFMPKWNEDKGKWEGYKPVLTEEEFNKLEDPDFKKKVGGDGKFADYYYNPVPFNAYLSQEKGLQIRIPGIYKAALDAYNDKINQEKEDLNNAGNDIDDVLGMQEAIYNNASQSKLRESLEMEEGDDLYISTIKRAADLTTEIQDEKKLEAAMTKNFKKDWKWVRDNFFPTIPKTDKSSKIPSYRTEKYKTYIKDNMGLIFDTMPISELTKMKMGLTEIIILDDSGRTRRRVSESEFDKEFQGNKYAGNTKRVKVKLTPELEQKLVDYYLSEERSDMKFESIMKYLANIIHRDAVLTGLQTAEYVAQHGEAKSLIGQVAQILNKNIDFKFSGVDGLENTIYADTENFKSRASALVRAVENLNFGSDNLQGVKQILALIDEDPAIKEFVLSLYDRGFVETADARQFKAKVKELGDEDLNNMITKSVEKGGQGALRYNKDSLDRLEKMANLIINRIGSLFQADQMFVDILGYHLRVLDPASQKVEIIDGKRVPKIVDGKTVSGEYYESKEKLLTKVLKDTRELGIKTDDIRLMTPDSPLWTKINKITSNGELSKGQKIDEIKKLNGEIQAANKANIEACRLIAKTVYDLYHEGKISKLDLYNFYQMQTTIAKGFRGLSTLEYITITDGIFTIDKNEHVNINGNTMFEVYKSTVEGDLQGVEDAFDNHSSWATDAITSDQMDYDPITGKKTLKTIEGNWRRFNFVKDSDQANVYGPNGEKLSDIKIRKAIEETTNTSPVLEENQLIKPTIRESSLSLDFNVILEETEGMDRNKRFSDAQGQIRGKAVDRYKILPIMPSGQDFKGLLYSFLGKGKQGEQQMQWFEDNLIDPYVKGIDNINKARQELKAEYKALMSKLPKVKKKLTDIVPGTKFNHGQAVRVYLWDKHGMEIPGISKRDQKLLVDVVNNNPDLITFANGLGKLTNKKEGYVYPTEYWTVESIASDLHSLTGKVGREQFLADFINNRKEIFGELTIDGKLKGPNAAKIEAIYGSKFKEALEDMLYRMQYGRRKSTGGDRITSNWDNWVNASVGTIMFFNMRSATLQTISALNYVDWENNTPFKAAKALANQPRFWSTVGRLWNSPFAQERLAGESRTINEAELAEFVQGKENKYKAALSYLLKIGFTPTRIADLSAITLGGATYVMNQEDFYESQGFSKQEATEKAMADWVKKSQESQQSSDAMMISQQQAGSLGRLILAFKNTPMQYARLIDKAVRDLKNGRGNPKEHLSKIAYYGFVQNLLFNFLQQAVWKAEADGEEWDPKHVRMVNGMFDSLVQGLGLGGNVVVSLKNGVITYNEQEKRGWNADHTYTIIKLANFSPTIGSKLRKIYGSIQSEKFNEEVIKEMPFWNLGNPAFDVMANLVSGLTNIPLDRAVNKIHNLMAAADSETEFWDSFALTLGWNTWDLGIETEAKKVKKELKEKKKAERKRCTAIKSNGDRCKNLTTNKSGKCYAHNN